MIDYAGEEKLGCESATSGSGWNYISSSVQQGGQSLGTSHSPYPAPRPLYFDFVPLFV